MDKDILQLIEGRHSVRRFKEQPIQPQTVQVINEYLKTLNEESGLDIRLIENSKKIFSGLLLKFAGWKNPPPAYFVFVGKSTPENDEKAGYYGEKLVLFVQSLGLNTCWVGLFSKSGVKAEVNASAIITIAVGYGVDGGKERKCKTAEEVSQYNGTPPQWFTDGVKCALKAPTAINRQAFMIKGEGSNVSLTYTNGPFSTVDVGIVKYHFEQGAGTQNFVWVNTPDKK